MAYDLVLEVAMKAQKFQQRNLLLNGPWKWLLDNFASYYGVSDAYTKLRYSNEVEWTVLRLNHSSMKICNVFYKKTMSIYINI